MEKDINSYWDKYQKAYSYEEFSAIYREMELIKSVSFKGKKVIEIGCGFKPLFNVVKEYSNYIAIEPGEKPFNSILEMSEYFKNVQVFNSTFEEWHITNKNIKADLIVLPGVLHELDDAFLVLEMCLNHLNPEGVLYINVPNVDSLHRKIAVAMGIIEDTKEKSFRNIEFGQKYNFSKSTLKELIMRLSKKVMITKLNTFFLKPFTHDQMLDAFSNGIIDKKVIDGLYKVSEEVEGLGSEIVCVLKLKDEKSKD